MPERRPERRRRRTSRPATPIEELLAGDLAEVLGVERGRRPRQLLRPRRPLAARDPGGLARPRGLRRRAAAPPPLRGADGRRPGAATDRRPSAHAGADAAPRCRRSCRCAGDGARCRSPSPRSGSGSSTSSSREAAYNVPLADPADAAGSTRHAARARPRRDRRRHEALRTTFARPTARPSSSSIPPRSFVPGAQRTCRPSPDRGCRGAAGGPRRRRRPFDLAAGRRCRARLLRLGRRRPRPAADVSTTSSATAGRSASSSASCGRSTTRSPAASRRRSRAADPVRRLRRLAAGVASGRGARRPARATGGSSLAGAPAVARAARRTSRARPSRRSGARHAVRTLPRPLLEPPEGARAAEGATLFMTLLAAFEVLLARVLRARRDSRRDPGRQPQPPRARGPDRLLHQHARPPRRHVAEASTFRSSWPASARRCSRPKPTRTCPSSCSSRS